MQKRNFLHFTAACLLGFTLNSCIQDELPNAEADIHSCTVPDLGDDLRSGGRTTTLSLGAHEVNIFVKSSMMYDLPEELTISPEFTLTEGATISPASGTPRMFKKSERYELTYTVTAEDGVHQKEYVVKIATQPEFLINDDNTRFFDFENYYTFKGSGRYHVLYSMFNGTNDYIWESANAGFAIVHGAAAENEYPTYCDENGRNGRCVKVTTSFVGSLGKMLNMPIAAGNFFVGTFIKDKAMQNPMAATRFGVCVTQEPASMDFWYKFQRGSKYTNEKMDEMPGVIDYPDVYGVLFKPYTDNNGNAVTLDGSNILTAPNIVLLAKLNYDEVVNETGNIAAAEWHHMKLDFQPQNGATVDQKALQNGEYFLAIVITSSYKGDKFYGAVGSTMYVDDMTVNFKPKPTE